ncbi:MAG: insulinase family protein [Treponema sp.]|nr:insulinase family protein [Treponema sp.]
MSKHYVIPAAFFFFFSIFSLNASVSEKIQEHTLENGLTVFLLEDTSSPFVNIIFDCKAGSYLQTPNTTGFFKLFSRIIQAENPDINFYDITCGDSSTKYTIKTTPSHVYNYLKRLSAAMFDFSFTDAVLESQLAELQKEVLANNNNLQIFINSAINTCLFPENPWKLNDELYPGLFNQSSIENARSIIKNIGDRCYTPKNSALFIYGNINTTEILGTVLETFGQYQSPFSPIIPSNQSYKNDNDKNITNKKFVIHHPDFSSELIQIIMEYPELSKTESRIIASMINENTSAIKQLFSTNESLHLPGIDYLNADSLKNRNNYSLRLQSILEKNSIQEQIALFLKLLTDNLRNFTENELQTAQNQLIHELKKDDSEPLSFMETLPTIWSTFPYEPFQEYFLEEIARGKSAVVQSYFAQEEELSQLNVKKIKNNLLETTPFVFILLNTKDFNDNKNALLETGFQEIQLNEKMTLWQNQMLNELIKNNSISLQEEIDKNNNYYSKNILDPQGDRPQFILDPQGDRPQFITEKKLSLESLGDSSITSNPSDNFHSGDRPLDTLTGTIGDRPQNLPKNLQPLHENTSDNNYYYKNLNLITSKELPNGIKLYTKPNSESSKAAILLNIQGGKLASADYNGFEELMIKLISMNIQKNLLNGFNSGLLSEMPQIEYECNLSSSYILLECSQSDFYTACEILFSAMIYDDIPPALADKAVSTIQFNKRIYNGNLVNQMFSAVVEKLISSPEKNNDFVQIFDSKNEVLQNISYTQILQYYPSMLDTKRMSIILCGNFTDECINLLNNTIGTLSNGNYKSPEYHFQSDFSQNDTLSVDLIHSFFSPPNSDRNAPMPSVLIPTTDFADPVLYIFKTPSKETKEYALFEALLIFIKNELQKEIALTDNLTNSLLEIIFPYDYMDFATLSVLNVKNKDELNNIFSQTIDNLQNQLCKETSENAHFIIQKIKDDWTFHMIDSTISPKGTAKLMQTGISNNTVTLDSTYYLQKYNFINSASINDIISIFNYFLSTSQLKIFSAQAK